MQNKLLKTVQMGVSLVILSWMGILPALAQNCAGWMDRDAIYWETITLEEVQKCLDNGKKANALKKSQYSLLHRAAANNKDPEIIKALVNAGADVNALGRNGQTPLHWAAELNQNPEVIMMLLKLGADGKIETWAVGSYDRNSKTPFEFAKNNKAIKDTDAYWALSDAQY